MEGRLGGWLAPTEGRVAMPERQQGRCHSTPPKHWSRIQRCTTNTTYTSITGYSTQSLPLAVPHCDEIQSRLLIIGSWQSILTATLDVQGPNYKKILRQELIYK